MDVGTGIAIASVCAVIIAGILKMPARKVNSNNTKLLYEMKSEIVKEVRDIAIGRETFKSKMETMDRWMMAVRDRLKDIESNQKDTNLLLTQIAEHIEK